MMRVRDGINRDLVRVANNGLLVSASEKRGLLHEAAAAIRWYQTLVAFSDQTANDHGADIAMQLDQFADNMELRYADEIKVTMLEAADTIRILRLFIGIQQEVCNKEDQVR